MNFIQFILTFKLNKFGGRVGGSLQFNSSLFATSLRSKSCNLQLDLYLYVRLLKSNDFVLMNEEE